MTDCCWCCFCWCWCCAAAAVVYEYVSTERRAPRALLLVPIPAPADCCSSHGEMRPPLTARRVLLLCRCCCSLRVRIYRDVRAACASLGTQTRASRLLLQWPRRDAPPADRASVAKQRRYTVVVSPSNSSIVLLLHVVVENVLDSESLLFLCTYLLCYHDMLVHGMMVLRGLILLSTK